MKIPLNITVDVNPAEWRAEFGHDSDVDVREDVRSYFLNHIQLWLGGQLGEDAATAYRTKG